MARILIVGGGVAGASTAWFLGRRGERDVVLLEREPMLGTQSSGKNAAVLRTLTSDPVTSEFARRSADFLHAPPPGFSPVPLVERTGLLLTADSKGAPDLARWFEESRGSEDGRVLEGDEARALAPHHAGEIAFAVLFPREGRIDIAALLAGFERGAKASGVDLRCGASVERLLVRDGVVHGVRLADGCELEADRTLLAAGGWAGELGRAAGSRVELAPTRRHLVNTAPDDEVDARWPVVWHHGEQSFYARPESGGLLVCGCDQTAVDPDHCTEDPAVLELVARRVEACLPSLADAGVASFWCGMRTFALDGRFAIGPDPDVAGLYWAAGLGGHGMVCSAGLGELAAARILGEPAETQAARAFDPRRLGEVAVPS